MRHWAAASSATQCHARQCLASQDPTGLSSFTIALPFGAACEYISRQMAMLDIITVSNLFAYKGCNRVAQSNTAACQVCLCPHHSKAVSIGSEPSSHLTWQLAEVCKLVAARVVMPDKLVGA